MKKLIEIAIRCRNSNFKFDNDLTTLALISFIGVQTIAIIRGFKLLLFLKNPKGALFSKGVILFNTSQIKFGKFLKLGHSVYINALGVNGVTLGNNVGIGAFSRIVVATSFNQIGNGITIGDNVGIGEFAYIGGAGGLKIGNDCIIGQYFSCHPENHFFDDLDMLIRNQGVSRKGISIGNNCWIGSKVTVLDGVTIGNGCVIAAGSVINKSFPSNSIIGGVPAKLLRMRD